MLAGLEQDKQKDQYDNVSFEFFCERMMGDYPTLAIREAAVAIVQKTDVQ